MIIMTQMRIFFVQIMEFRLSWLITKVNIVFWLPFFSYQQDAIDQYKIYEIRKKHLLLDQEDLTDLHYCQPSV